MNEGRVKTAIVGVGRWGSNVARELATVSDLSAIVSATPNEPSVKDLSDSLSVPVITLEELCARTDISAVWVSTPIATHYSVANQLLSSNKNVMLEKPATGDTEKLKTLVEEASRRKLIFATGYIFLYHPVFLELKKRINPENIVNMSFNWQKYGTFNELIELNLFTHHLSLALNLFGQPQNGKMEISANGNVLDAELNYPKTLVISHIDREKENMKKHTIEITMSDGTSYLWEDSKLNFRSSQKEQYSVIFETKSTALAVEVDAFINTISTGDSHYLNSSGKFGVSVLENLGQL